mgnify:CR=1 FL=1
MREVPPDDLALDILLALQAVGIDLGIEQRQAGTRGTEAAGDQDAVARSCAVAP